MQLGFTSISLFKKSFLDLKENLSGDLPYRWETGQERMDSSFNFTCFLLPHSLIFKQIKRHIPPPWPLKTSNKNNELQFQPRVTKELLYNQERTVRKMFQIRTVGWNGNFKSFFLPSNPKKLSKAKLLGEKKTNKNNQYQKKHNVNHQTLKNWWPLEN